MQLSKFSETCSSADSSFSLTLTLSGRCTLPSGNARQSFPVRAISHCARDEGSQFADRTVAWSRIIVFAEVIIEMGVVIVLWNLFNCLKSVLLTRISRVLAMRAVNRLEDISREQIKKRFFNKFDVQAASCHGHDSNNVLVSQSRPEEKQPALNLWRDPC